MQLLLLVSVLAQTNPITLADYIPTRFVRYPGEYHGGWSLGILSTDTNKK